MQWLEDIKIYFKLSIKSRKDNIKTPGLVKYLGWNFKKQEEKKKKVHWASAGHET